MHAHRIAAALFAGFLIAAAPHPGTTAALAAASSIEADPHELYDRARARLEAGHLEEAAALLQKLQALVAARPEWDPDGTFTRDLVPPLQARLVRLEGAAAALDEFRDRALRDVQAPDFKQDLSTVKDYTHWATTEVARLRSERDALVAQRLPNPEDAALLMRTESYARTERLLEGDLLAKMSDAAGDDILGLLAGDPRLEAVLTRFRQLKRDLIEASEERDRLQARLLESESRDRALRAVLDAILADGVGTPAAPKKAGTADPETEAANAGARLSRVVLARRDALLHRRGLTDTERSLVEADLGRFRLVNRLIVAAGLGSDQRGAIARLERTVAALPSEDPTVASATTPDKEAPTAADSTPASRGTGVGWSLGGILALLVAAALFAVVLLGGRRVATATTGRAATPAEPASGAAATRSEGADAGRDAA
jgi:hypothetical protein